MGVPEGWRRLTVDLPGPVRDRLGAAAEGDGVTPPARLRALATLWESDPVLQARASDLAMSQKAAARQRAVRSRRATLRARATT